MTATRKREIMNLQQSMRDLCELRVNLGSLARMIYRRGSSNNKCSALNNETIAPYRVYRAWDELLCFIFDGVSRLPNWAAPALLSKYCAPNMPIKKGEGGKWPKKNNKLPFMCFRIDAKWCLGVFIIRHKYFSNLSKKLVSLNFKIFSVLLISFLIYAVS